MVYRGPLQEDRVLTPLYVILASSQGTCLETARRGFSALLVSGQGIWPRIVVRVLHLLCVSFAIS